MRGNDPNLKSGNVQQWNLTLQYALAKDWVFEVGYVGNKGTHLSRFWNANQPNVAGPSGTLAARRPNTGFGDVEYMDSGGNSFYNSLQTRLEKRFSNGLTLLHSFTYARGLDNVGAWNDPNGSLYPQDAYNFANEKALAENIVKFNSVASWVYELPFGRGRKMMASAPPLVEAIARRLAGGWNLDLAHRSAFDDRESRLRQLPDGRRPRAFAPMSCPASRPSVSNPSALRVVQSGGLRSADHALWHRRTRHHLGARPAAMGPRLRQEDSHLSERRYFQFRGEMFNAFNKVNYEPPVSTVGSAGFGTITSARPGRNVQLGLKFYW